MENNESLKYYDKASRELTDALKVLQTKVDEFVKASDLLVASQPVNIRFYNVVNSGLIVESFSKLVESIGHHVAGLKTAMTPKKGDVTPEQTPKGSSSES